MYEIRQHEIMAIDERFVLDLVGLLENTLITVAESLQLASKSLLDANSLRDLRVAIRELEEERTWEAAKAPMSDRDDEANEEVLTPDEEDDREEEAGRQFINELGHESAMSSLDQKIEVGRITRELAEGAEDELGVIANTLHIIGEIVAVVAKVYRSEEVDALKNHQRAVSQEHSLLVARIAKP